MSLSFANMGVKELLNHTNGIEHLRIMFKQLKGQAV